MRKQTEDLPSLGSYGKAGEDENEDEDDYDGRRTTLRQSE